MTEIIKRKNFLVLQGQILAEGRRGEITPSEWLYLYRQVEDHLNGVQSVILAALELQIRKRKDRAATPEAVAL